MKQTYISITTEALREVDTLGDLTAGQAAIKMVEDTEAQINNPLDLTPADIRAGLLNQIACSLIIIGHIDNDTFTMDNINV